MFPAGHALSHVGLAAVCYVLSLLISCIYYQEDLGKVFLMFWIDTLDNL